MSPGVKSNVVSLPFNQRRLFCWLEVHSFINIHPASFLDEASFFFFFCCFVASDVSDLQPSKLLCPWVL